MFFFGRCHYLDDRESSANTNTDTNVDIIGTMSMILTSIQDLNDRLDTMNKDINIINICHDWRSNEGNVDAALLTCSLEHRRCLQFAIMQVFVCLVHRKRLYVSRLALIIETW